MDNYLQLSMVLGKMGIPYTMIGLDGGVFVPHMDIVFGTISANDQNF